jgi:hypothetical protein
MSFFMLITGRHLKLFYRARQIFHALCGTVMLACTIICIQFAEWGSFKPDVENRMNHYALGEYLEYSVITISVFGYILKGLILLFGCLTGVKTSHWRIIWVLKNVHKLFGKLLIAFSVWTMLAGSFSYEDGWNYIKYLLLTHWAGYLIATLVLEIIHCSRRRHKKYGTDLVFPSNLPDMTISDFDREVNKGAQWCLFDNYVIDLKPFIASHPGGPFLL